MTKIKCREKIVIFFNKFIPDISGAIDDFHFENSLSFKRIKILSKIIFGNFLGPEFGLTMS